MSELVPDAPVHAKRLEAGALVKLGAIQARPDWPALLGAGLSMLRASGKLV